MKKSNSEGVATHADPEPCVVVRKDGGEASAGARAGRVLSREIQNPQRKLRHFEVPTPWGKAEGKTVRADIARRRRTSRGRRPRARTESTRSGTGRSRPWLREMGPSARIVKPKAGEAAEQSRATRRPGALTPGLHLVGLWASFSSGSCDCQFQPRVPLIPLLLVPLQRYLIRQRVASKANAKNPVRFAC